MSDSPIAENIEQMLVDREYKRIDDSDTFYPAIFVKCHPSVIDPQDDNKNNENILYVYWETESIDKKRIIANVQQMRKAKVRKAIIVSKYQISIKARNLFYTLGRDPLPEVMKKKNGIVSDEVNQNLYCTFELFDEIEFQVNLIKHSLIPRHIALTDIEKQKFLAENKLLETQLPAILQSDAICRHYGWRKGILIKIIRTYEGVESIYYRLVI